MKTHLMIGFSILLAASACASSESKSEAPEQIKECTDTHLDAATPFACGAGTLESPYTISTSEQLLVLSEQIDVYGDKHFVLTADINMEGIELQPIGNADYAFAGSFGGQEYSVHNVTIIRPAMEQVGFFGYIEGATIRNFGLENVNMQGRHRVGGLVGMNDNGTIDNSYAVGTVTGEGQLIGGLVGTNQGTVTNSYAVGSVSSMDQIVGGLVGENRGAIADSYALSMVQGNARREGGLVGWNIGGSIRNSHASGSVIGHQSTGGLVGENEYGSITNSYAEGSVTGSVRKIGGLVGANTKGTIENSYASGEVDGPNAVGGLVGENDKGTLSGTNYYTDTDDTQASLDGIGGGDACPASICINGTP